MAAEELAVDRLEQLAVVVLQLLAVADLDQDLREAGEVLPDPLAFGGIALDAVQPVEDALQELAQVDPVVDPQEG